MAVGGSDNAGALMLGLGTRDTVTTFPLTASLRACLRREIVRGTALGALGALILALGILPQLFPVWAGLHVLGWLVIIPAALMLAQGVLTLASMLGDLRGGVYMRRTGAVETDLTITRGTSTSSRHYWLTMMGWRYEVSRDTYDLVRAIPYASIEHTPGGMLLRVRDFDGHILYARWPGEDFPPVDGEQWGRTRR